MIRKLFFVTIGFILFTAGVSGQNDVFLSNIQFEIIAGNTDNQGSYFFINNGTSGKFLVISDELGFPLYKKKVTTEYAHFQPHDQGFLSCYIRSANGFCLFDSKYRIYDTIKLAGEFNADMHEFYMDNEKNYWMVAYPSRQVDMSQIVEGGDPGATVSGVLIQQISQQDSLLFQWDGWSHFDIADSYINLTTSSIDYVHCNSIQRDTDSSIVISSRNLSEISRIDTRTGDFIWRLGGKKNQFTFIDDPRNGFYGQHTAWLADGDQLTLFDNGIFEAEYSRALKYHLDADNMQVELLTEHIYSTEMQSIIMGNYQLLPNDHSMIFWGASRTLTYGIITEYDEKNDLVFEAHIENSAYSYRVYQSNWKSDLLSMSKDTSYFFLHLDDSHTLEKTILTNNSETEITINEVAYSASGFRLLDTLPLTLAPDESRELNVLFEPDRIGEYKSKMYFSSVTDTLIVSKPVVLIGEALTLSAEGRKQFEDVRVFPVPFKDHISIDVNSEKSVCSVEISDVYGKLLYQNSFTRQITELDYLPEGVYVLTLISEKGRYSRIVVK